MAVWAAKKRFVYGISFLLAIGMIFGVIFWKIIYRAPTCSDGIKNGDELGIDCGGSCQNLCTTDTLTPVVLWSKVFHISSNVYTAVAYIQNPNISSRNDTARYEFKIYDAKGNILTTREGETSIPKNQKFLVFQPGIVIKSAEPKSADFEFTKYSTWTKDNSKDPEFGITYSPLLGATTSPKVTGTISNNTINSYQNVEVDVLILDSKENAVAASQSYVDNLGKGKSQDFVFTWPQPFNLGVESCANPLDVMLAIDKSGSMRSEGLNPPEPFTTVLNTAKDFIKNLSDDDQIGIISFGTNSTLESSLTKNKDTGLSAVNGILFSTTTLEQTNISGGLKDALDELMSGRGRDGAKKVLVLLTDGVPTLPTQQGNPNYPVDSAEAVSRDLLNGGVEIYTIGLGKNINESFLKSISTDDAHYFFAPGKETLSGIYGKIGTTICPKKPNVVSIIYRIP